MGKLLDRMEPLLAAMPAVKSPEGHVHFKNKLLWTAGILILYFVMTNIPLWGLDPNSMDLFEYYRALLAGASGSLVQLGIGPIVTASIVLQLLKGADILHIDTAEVRGQVLYMGLQKLLIFVMIIIEALPNLIGGFLLPDPVIADMFFGGSLTAVSFIIFIQICIGGVLIMFMDEVVTKWGIGSGVGLFIIAGISQAIINGLISWIPVTDQYAVGFFPRLVQVIMDGADFLQYMGPELLAFITTIAIFLIVTYVESTRIEIPLAHAQVRGARARFPVKLIYASVLPMILVRVLQANIQMIGLFLYNIGITIFGTFSGAQAVSGLMYYLAPINGPSDWMWWNPAYGITNAPWEILIRLSIDITF
ncbi:MAG TPA: preprotein translocase subunit SecY, partial [Methanoregulaceae archaeon]|nr:preprotein translocase subunit SecY [Methanoregulaceae archaeon]